MSTHTWWEGQTNLPYQVLALALGLDRAQWESISRELDLIAPSGDAVADFAEAARVAGVEVRMPADWGMRPEDAAAAREEDT